MRLDAFDFPSHDLARMITLYGISTSSAGRCVWALEEIGLDWEQVPIHFNDGGARTPEYLAINPNARIPP